MTTSIRSNFVGRARMAVTALAIAAVALAVAPATSAQAATSGSTSVVATAPGTARDVARLTGSRLVVTPLDSNWSNLKGGSSKSIFITLTNTSKKNITVAPSGLGIEALPGTGSVIDRGVINTRLAKTTLKPGQSVSATVTLLTPKKGTQARGLRTDVDFIVR